MTKRAPRRKPSRIYWAVMMPDNPRYQPDLWNEYGSAFAAARGTPSLKVVRVRLVVVRARGPQ